MLGDRVQLQQVIINLLINGIQAMASVTDRPRELVIRSRQTMLARCSSRCRTPASASQPENESRLFNAFFTTKPQGMGMGLSICRSIIEAHGGRIWASRNIGAGATFQFVVPSIQKRGP